MSQAAAKSYILIVEDNPADVFLIRAALTAANLNYELRVARDGEQAIRCFDQADAAESPACPALVILDINLPRRRGGEVLQYLRSSLRCGDAPVLMISTSDSTRDRDEMKRLGANGYFTKPSDYTEFMKLGDIVRDLLGVPCN